MWPTKDDITQILVENIVGQGKKFDGLQNSWFTKHLIIALRETIWVIILMVQMVYKNLSVRTASGSDLDDKGYDFGVDRKKASKAVHTVTLHKSTEVLYELPVPDGFLLSTMPIGNEPPLKFIVGKGQGLCIKKGEKSVSNVLVECTEYGVIGNVPDNAINLVAQAGFDYVTDSKLYIAAAEQETDNLYRARILERKRSPARAGVPADWERWAKEVQGVAYAKCFRCARGAGTADIVIWGEEGELPARGLIEKCQRYFDEKYIPADLSDGGILVVSPEAVTVDISIADVKLKKGYTAEMAAPIIKSAFTTYFKSGKILDILTIVDCIVCIRTAFDSLDSEKAPIIEDFKLLEPSNNILLTAKQCPIIGDVTIKVV